MAEKKPLKKQAEQAILQKSFLRWESAVVISLTLILAVIAPQIDALSFIPAWVWLLGGSIAEAALVFSSLRDPEFGRQVVADLLDDKFQPQKLNDKRLQYQIDRALDYRSRIEASIRDQDDSMLKDELHATAVQIDDWLENIYNLARRIDRYRKEQKVLSRDREQAQRRILQLEKEAALEVNTAVKQQIEATLDAKRRQLDTITRLDNTIQRAELQMENTLTHLGTIYSQTMLVDAKDIDGSRARRLRQQINDEVVELNDVLLAMDDVYAAGAEG